MSLRLLYLPLNVPGDEQVGTENGFRINLGDEKIKVFDYLAYLRGGGKELDKAFREAVASWSPDWIHMQIQSETSIQPDLLRSLKKENPRTVFSHWMGDWRATVPPLLAEICKVCDVSFISNEGQIPMYKSVGAPRVEYWQNAVTHHIDVQPLSIKDLPFKVPEVVFCGNYYGGAFPGSAQRLEVVRALLKADINFGVVGGGWPADIRPLGSTGPRMQRHIYDKCLVSVGVDNMNECDRFYSERQLAAMAAGKAHVCWGSPGKEKDFQDGEHCVFFKTPEEAVEKVKSLLADAETREKIGRQGQELIIAKHLWPERVAEIIPMIQELWAAKAS